MGLFRQPPRPTQRVRRVPTGPFDFVCGAECPSLTAHWPDSGGSPSITASGVRSGAGAIQINPTVGTEYVRWLAPQTKRVIVFSGWLTFPTLPGTTQLQIARPAMTVGQDDIYMRFNQSTSKLELAYHHSPGVDVVASTNTISAGTRYHIEVRTDFSTATYTYEWRIDGVAQPSGSTVVGASDFVFGAQLGTNSSTTFDTYWDDVAISSNSADYPIAAGYYVPPGTPEIMLLAETVATNAQAEIANGTGVAYQSSCLIKPSALYASGTGSIGSAPSTYVADDFSDTQVDTWADADTGGTWAYSGTAANYDKTSGAGLLAVPGSGAILGATVPGSAADVDAYARFSVPTTGANVGCGIVARATDATLATCYYGGIWFESDNTVTAFLHERAAGSHIENAFVLNQGTYTADQWWWVRFQIIGTDQRVKIWANGSQEPTAWNTTDIDSTISAAGRIGIIGRSGSSAGAQSPKVDDLTVLQVVVVGASAKVSPNAAAATGTGAALNTSSLVLPSIGLASGTGSALSPPVNLQPNANVGTGTGAAGGPSSTVQPGPTIASGTGAAGGTPTTLASDDFSDTVASSLGTADVGGAWTISGTAADYDKTGGLGVIEVAASGIHFGYLNTLAVQDSDITVMTKVTTLPTGGNVFSYLTSRNQAATDLYWTQLEWRTTGGIRGGIARRIGNTGSGGTLVALDDVAFGSLTYTAGDWFWMRMQTIGTSPTTIRLKIWKDGTAEPTSWQQETTDSTSPLQSTGALGIGNNAGSGLSNGPAFTSFETFTATTIPQGASVKISPNAAAGTGTGSAGLAAAKVSPNAAAATGTGTASNTSATVSVGGTGVASDGITRTIASDTFTRTLSNSWGTATVGGPWTITLQTGSSDADVDGDLATLVVGVAGQNTQAMLADVLQRDVDITVNTSINKIPTGASAFLHVGARAIGTAIAGSTRYIGQVEVTTAGLLNANFTKFVGGTQTAITSAVSTGVTVTANQLFKVRFQASGASPTTLRIKVWLAADSEPSTWLTENSSDSEATLQGLGGLSLRMTTSGSLSNAPISFGTTAYDTTWVGAYGDASAAAASLKTSAGSGSGTGAAGGSTSKVSPTPTAASGTGAASLAGPSVAVSGGTASGTGIARDATATTALAELAFGAGTASNPGKTVAVNAGSAAGTGEAYIAAVSAASDVQANAGHASGSGAAANISVSIAQNSGAASGSGAAGAASLSLQTSAAAGSGTGAAGGSTSNVGAGPGAGTGTGAAHGSTGTISAPIQSASGTGAASNASKTVAPNGAAASGTGAANNAKLSLATTSGVASGTGSSGGPSSTVATTGGVAAGTGAASDADGVGGAAPAAGAASGTGSAANSAASIAVNADVGAGTGAALNPTVTTDANTNAAAGTASGTGQALNASINLQPNAAAGSGTGAANNSTTIIQTTPAAASGTGTASNPGGAVTFTSGAASGSGAAGLAAALVASNGGAASGSGAAGGTTSTVQTTPAQGSGTGSAFAPGGTTSFTSQVASGTGTAGGTSSSVAPSSSAASGTGAAGEADATGDPQVAPDAATGTGSAGALSASVAPNLGVASGTGAAFVASITTDSQTNAPAGHASGSGTAYDADAVPAQAPSSGAASGTGLAFVARGSIASQANLASASGAANTGSITLTTLSGTAGGTGAAGGPASWLKVNASAGAGSGSAFNATVTTENATQAQAQPAMGSGTAYGPSQSVVLNSGAASGTGVAQLAIAKIGSQAGSASGSGTAGGTSSSVSTTTNTAVGTGTAYDADANAEAVGAAQADAALGSGQAFAPTINTDTNAQAGLASGIGTAFNANRPRRLIGNLTPRDHPTGGISPRGISGGLVARSGRRGVIVRRESPQGVLVGVGGPHGDIDD